MIGKVEASGVVKVSWLNGDAMGRWNAFVGNHPLGSIYHLSGWKDSLESGFPHMKGHFLVLEDDSSGEILAGVPIYAVKSWLFGNKLVSVPFATACNPLISSSSHMDLLFPHLVELYDATSSHDIELRTMSRRDLIDRPDLKISTAYKHHYLELVQSADDLRRRFSKTAIQQMIVKAEKAGIKVERRHAYGDLEAFYRLLMGTRKRLGLPQIPFKFFDSLWAKFGVSNLVLLLASTERKRTVGGLMGLVFNKSFVFEYSADTLLSRHQGVGQLMCWTAIKLACESGYAMFSFGRTSSRNQGLLIHKRRWATKEEDLVVFRYSKSGFSLPSVDRLGLGHSLIRMMVKMAPAPIYRLMGDLYYDHWA